MYNFLSEQKQSVFVAVFIRTIEGYYIFSICTQLKKTVDKGLIIYQTDHFSGLTSNVTYF
jgi:hypothetical protein